MPNTSFTLNKRIGAAKAKEISTIENFVEGYRNREDSTILKPQTLVAGSHDVLIDVSGRVTIRNGYYIDGSKSNIASITRPLADWTMQNGFIHHLRAGGINVGGDGQLQLRYIDTLGALGTIGNTYWLPLLTSLSSVYFQSSNYWDSTALKAELLLVNRSSIVWEWTGAIGTIASIPSSSSIVLNGPLTLAQLFFDSSGHIINNGIVYQYDSITGNTFNLHAGTPDPTGSVVNSPVYQQPVSFTFANLTFGAITTPPPTGFTVDLVGVLSSNQVLFASISNNLVYLSQAGNFQSFDQSAARIQYQGDVYTTIGNVTAFAPQEDEMYISSGLDQWYTTEFVLNPLVDPLTNLTVNYETTQLASLKVTAGQAAQSQYMTTKIKDSVVFISNEPIMNTFGRVTNILLTPQMTDESFPIVNDMNAYTFTDSSLFYFKQKIYLTIPTMGIVRIFNMTNPKSPFWEAPQYLPISGFCAVGNTLIGHSYNTFESYVMFTGNSDRALSANQTGIPISWNMTFAFQNLGLRAKRKSFNKFFTEGFINSATTVMAGLVYRSPGVGINPSQTLTISGTGNYVLQNASEVSLGKSSLGKNPLGGDIQFPEQFNLPPYFALISLTPRVPWLAFQPTFFGSGIGQQFSLLAYGSNASPTNEMEVEITQ